MTRQNLQLVLYHPEDPAAYGLTSDEIKVFQTALNGLSESFLDYTPQLRQMIASEKILLQVQINLVDEREIAEINEQTRGMAEVTDVLSFPNFNFREEVLAEPLRQHDLIDPTDDTRRIDLGDILICPQRAREQATQIGQDLNREMKFLTVHGLLHLIGYDHQRPTEENKMLDLQRAIMARSEAEAAPDIHSRINRTDEANTSEFRSGIVALAGEPNVGKSTLLNALLGEEVAIATPRPQTTRHLIRGVIDRPHSQIVMIDTPGMHQPQHELGRQMCRSASNAVQEADIMLLLIDARREPRVGKIERRLIRLAVERGLPIILAINKVDLADKRLLLALIQAYADFHPFAAVVPISACQHDGLDLLLTEIEKLLPGNAPIFAPEDYTDQTEKIVAAELIRAEILEQIDDEIPHGIAVSIDEFEEKYVADVDSADEPSAREPRRVRVAIRATVQCEQANHKAILIGKKGQRIREIGSSARKRIAAMLDCPCDLMLFVKVRENWRNRHDQLRNFDW